VSGEISFANRARLARTIGRPALGVFEASTTLVGILLVVRPLTEPYNRSVGGVTMQQIWGALFVLALAGVATTLERRDRRVALGLVGIVAFDGALGAALGPVTGAALREWFWVTLLVATVALAWAAADRYALLPLASAVGLSGVMLLALALVNGDGSTSHVPQPGNTFIGQLSAGFVSAHTFAFACVGALAWAIVLFFLVDGAWQIATGVLVVTLIVMIQMSTIRTAEVAMAVLLAFAVVATFVRGRRIATWRRLAFVGAVVVAAASGFSYGSSNTNRWSHALNGGYQPSASAPVAAPSVEWAGSGRGWLWHQAFRNWRERDVVHQALGSGWSASAYYTAKREGTPYAAHDDVLELLVSVGVLGVLVSGAIVAVFAAALWRARSRLTAHGELRLWLVGVGAAGAVAAMALITGFLTYTTGAIPMALLLGAVIGRWRRGTPADRLG
jgi:hypothetical protein